MKYLFSLSVALCFALLSIAQPPKGPANQGMTFGEKTDRQRRN